MIQSMMQTTSQTSARLASEFGPVLLAATPFGGMDAPIAAARWYAAHEQRELRVVAALDNGETRGGPETSAPVPLDCRDMRRRMLAEQLRRELTQHGLNDDAAVEVLDGH